MPPAMQLELWREMVAQYLREGHCDARQWAEAAAEDDRIESDDVAYAVLEHWTELGIWEYGVSVRCGWVPAYEIGPESLTSPEAAALFVSKHPGYCRSLE